MGEQIVIGELNQKVIDTFGLSMAPGSTIYCGQDNIDHMKKEHPEAFEKYFKSISEIIENPTYICKHPNKSSIEYVKEYIEDNGEHVLVAVRATAKGILFARTLFVMDDEKVRKYHLKDAFKHY